MVLMYSSMSLLEFLSLYVDLLAKITAICSMGIFLCRNKDLEYIYIYIYITGKLFNFPEEELDQNVGLNHFIIKTNTHYLGEREFECSILFQICLTFPMHR